MDCGIVPPRPVIVQTYPEDSLLRDEGTPWQQSIPSRKNPVTPSPHGYKLIVFVFLGTDLSNVVTTLDSFIAMLSNKS